MSRELIEFSNLIDEQFEPDTNITDELWSMIQGWLAPQSVKAGTLNTIANANSSNEIAA
ncbi:hypothetical protein MUGA111182_15475 [Mucilaginibacter galii]|uniref:Uncharacterized protein n=1 Tax=Mucilaginibacter galii TaxID=2005073 RepID=A0A917JDG4_9SPHI|nr:hypothetical protein [Mucilaginibacter galii]GGI52527.1 hypothetical protein GCM10011425_37390 [Mucilaginibacter galii]